MNNCVNHSETEAAGVCHFCGRPFCKECLVEGIEYYSCKNSECLKLNVKKILPAEVCCPLCNKKFTLREKDRVEVKIHCPSCESMIDFSTTPPTAEEPKKYVQIFASLNQGDLFIMKSILDDAEIDYYTSGENFLSVDPLIQPARFYILESQAELADELLKEARLNIMGVSFREGIED